MNAFRRALVNIMSLNTIVQALAIASVAVPCSGEPLRALVYRGKTACEGCPESLRDLLVAAVLHITVTFAGPDEPV